MIAVRALNKLSVRRNNRFSSSHFSKATMASDAVANLNKLFACGVSAVQAKNIFRAENFTVNEREIVCNFNGNRVQIDINNNKRCHLVGFGKAVYGMTSEVSKVLGERLQSGIISVPLSIQENFSDIHLPSTIQVLEGAKNNLPDEAAENAALKIVKFAKQLNENDILFVLVSGGGSALLPLPCSGVSLREKLQVIKQLANKGASISDLNRVRIDLSQTKGGKLANCARNAGAVIAFIISDIVGDPIHLIASGPTVQSEQSEELSIDVLKRFNLWHSLPVHIRNVLKQNCSSSLKKENCSMAVNNVQNLVIANNEIAVQAVMEEMIKIQMNGIVMSTKIEGNVADVSKAYFELSKYIQQFRTHQINDGDFLENVLQLRHPLRFRDSFLENIAHFVRQSMDFCVIGAGEPTVEVTGNGVGGRNQELAFRFSQLCFDDNLTQDVLLLSAGTDGIDGPTTAAGAIGGIDIIRNFLMIPGKCRNDIDTYLRENDSFNFYSELSQGKYHIVTGHTGTNVMDIHLLYFKQSN